MKYTNIHNTDIMLTDNFNMKEFYKPKYLGCVEFDIPNCLILGAQILRDFLNVPIQITSTIRKSDTFGYHTNGNAIDLLPLKDMMLNILKFKQECVNYQNGKESFLINGLRSIGVQGFGIENVCIHLDFRNGNNVCDTDKYGKYIVFTWHSDNTPNGTSNVIKKC